MTLMAINLRYKYMDTLKGPTFLIDPKKDPADSSFGLLAPTGEPEVWRCAYGDNAAFSEDELRYRVPARLKRMLPKHPDADQVEIVQCTPYRIHQRCTATHVKGRVVLIGDAAHINNPFGGLGLMTGLLDAHTTTNAITTSLNDSSKAETALSYYNSTRRKAFLEATNPMSINNLKLCSEESEEADQIRKIVLGAMNSGPEAQRQMNMSLDKVAEGVPGYWD